MMPATGGRTRSRPTLGDWLASAALLTGGAAMAWPVLLGGYETYLDNPAHLAELFSLAKPDATGWSDIAFCGYPLHTLHSPLWFGGAASAIRAGVAAGPLYAVLVFCGLCAPAIALYFVAQRRVRRRIALSLAFLLLLQPPLSVGVGSATGGMWTFHLASAGLLLLADRVARARPRSPVDISWIAALVACIGLTHLFVLAAALGLMLLQSALDSLTAERGLARRLASDWIAASMGLLTSAPLWLPNLMAADSIRWVQQSLSSSAVLRRLLLPGDTISLLLGEPGGSASSLFFLETLPMWGLVGVGAAGCLAVLRHRDVDPLARLGAVLATALLTLLVGVTPYVDLAFLGPLSWRWLWFVRLAFALAALGVLTRASRPAPSSEEGQRAATTHPLQWVGGLSLALALCLLWSLPLAQVTPRHDGRELADVRSLWRWLASQRSVDWGRVYLQSTYRTPPLDSSLAHSHVLAATEHASGVSQLGAFYGVAPYPTALWTPGEFGQLFRITPDSVEAIDEIERRMQLANAKLLVLSDPGRRGVFQTHGGFAERARFGRFSVLERRESAGGPASPAGWLQAEAAGVTLLRVERRAGVITAEATNSGPMSDVSIAESYHPFWRVDAPPGAQLEARDGGLMRLTGLPRGGSSIALRYRAPAVFGWLAFAGGFAIAMTALAGRRYQRRERRQHSRRAAEGASR